MLELGVADAAHSAAWYATHLGYQLERDDAANGFVLLRRNDSRLALKVGTPAGASVKLHFELPSAGALAELAARLTTAGVAVSGPKASDEGYARVRFADPRRPRGGGILLGQVGTRVSARESPVTTVAGSATCPGPDPATVVTGLSAVLHSAIRTPRSALPG